MKTLIVYSSKYGTTEKCAQRIQNQLGEGCDLVNLSDKQTTDLSAYDTIMLGSSIYAGKMRPDVVKFVSDQENVLRDKSFGVFLCCKDEGAEALRYIEDNLPQWAWDQAFLKTSLGHEVNLDKMNFFERGLFKFIFKVKESYSKLDEANIEKLIETILENE